MIMKKTKKGIIFAVIAVLALFILSACGTGNTATTANNPSTTPVAESPAASDTNDTEAPGATDGNETPEVANGSDTESDSESDSSYSAITGPIDVISREAGSGTRGAFIEVLGIELDGVDRTYIEAVIQTGTGAVIGAVSNNEHAIGYISLGALRDDVRAVPINGVEASPANVQNGSYPLYRNFNLAVPRNLSPLAQDFLDFILSAEGQDVVAAGYIAVGDNLSSFTGGGLSGSLVIEGSTSVAPLMERLAVAYMDLNPDVDIAVHSTGSGAGITGAIEGRVDLGLASRELRESELEEVDSIIMAHDGLAVIVHNDNNISSLSPEDVRDIFIGELNNWSNIN